MKMSPVNWLLCGKSAITPVTRSGSFCAHATCSRPQAALAMPMVFPIGSASPKYLRAVDCEITADSGCCRTCAGSPLISGSLMVWKKLESTSSMISKNCRSPILTVMPTGDRRVAAVTSGKWPFMKAARGNGATAETIGGRPGGRRVTST